MLQRAGQAYAQAFASMIFTPASEEGDYSAIEDRLLYCGNCHTPRQARMDLFGDGDHKVVPVTCQCHAMLLDAQEEADRLRRAEQKWKARREQAFGDSRWRNASFKLDDQRDDAASAVCRSYAHHFPDMLAANLGLMLYGDIGTGKTFLAACIANAVIDLGHRVVMDSLPTLIGGMGLGEEREEAMQRLMKADLLILDDVGVERGTEYSIEQSYEIINARYRSGKPLIVTTNLSMQDIRQERSTGRRRSFDRIVEMCRPLLIKGKSRRPGIAEDKRAMALLLLEGRNG